MKTEINTAVPKLKSNMDTDLLKLIAIMAMLVDHIGGAFFKNVGIFRWTGRIAFPIFCYCMTVGLLYTSDIKKYLKRLALFAIISQPFYIFAFHTFDWRIEWSNMNIFFTLFVTMLAMVGVKERKWWLFILCVVVLAFFSFDYATTGVILMLIFYLCRNNRLLGAGLYCLCYVPALFNGSPENPLNLAIGPFCVDWTAFSLLAAPLIFLRTESGLKINKYFFYAFYPAHLAALGVIRLLIS